jgi:hypothetical protein
MARISVSNKYDSSQKRLWRSWVYSHLSPEHTTRIVDKDNTLRYDILELIGEPKECFSQILGMPHLIIPEDKLSGVDRVKENVVAARKLYPKGSFHHADWEDFCQDCLSNNHFEYGIINFDYQNALCGKPFERVLEVTVELACHCAMNIGECLLVVNTIVGWDARTGRLGDGSMEGRYLQARSRLKDTLETEFLKHYPTEKTVVRTDPESMYLYRQEGAKDHMLSCAVLLSRRVERYTQRYTLNRASTLE